MAARKRAPYVTKAERLEKSKMRRQVMAVFLFIVSGLFLLSCFNLNGTVLMVLREGMLGLFGASGFLLFIPFAQIAIYLIIKPQQPFFTRALLYFLLPLSSGGLFHVFSGFRGETAQALYDAGNDFLGGGVLSGFLANKLIIAISSVGAAMVFILLILVWAIVTTGVSLKDMGTIIAEAVKGLFSGSKDENTAQRKKGKEKAGAKTSVGDMPPWDDAGQSSPPFNIDIPLSDGRKKKKDELFINTTIELSPPNVALPDLKAKAESITPLQQEEINKSIEKTLETTEPKYTYPPYSLLGADKRPVSLGETEDDLKANALRLLSTLKSFGVEAKVVGITQGPTITRYDIQSAMGTKLSKITGLADDIALALSAGGVRIAAIPDKGAIGIEVPNKKISMVHLRKVIQSREFREAKSNIAVALGQDISGTDIVADLSQMPHLLIAGATGSGKSVCINSIIMSLLYKSSPKEVRMLMIDPKVVELGVYNGIPHLLIPVVTDPKKAAGALNWAVREMLHRYQLFAAANVRDLKGYNKANSENTLPEIVILIDELSDLMMVAPSEVEDAICRLAQMARAAGMHLIIATQRPSVDVITGTIKANIPSRIAFSVSSQVDSRTILDMAGAEKLLGKGDMLYHPVGAPKPRRMQGCFVSDTEVEKVVEFVKKGYETEYDEAVIEEIEKGIPKSGSGKAGGDDSDVMLNAAIEVVVDTGMASVSLLQRKLKLGYARAARIIDELEERGIVGHFEGAKPRQVMITRAQYQEMIMRQQDEQ